MISCLMVTRAGREAEIERSLACFASQSLSDCELVVTFDSDPSFSTWLGQQVACYPGVSITPDPQPPGQPLGALRNSSLKRASHEVICQWDDDDLNHPDRLEVQYQRLRESDSDFCFLTDEIHLFMEDGIAFWDDWTVERPPGHLIQGTIMGYRDRMPAYPAMSRGEDTPVTWSIVESGCRVEEIRDAGWLHVYCFTGKNAWEIDHHKAISQWKRLGVGALTARESILRRELSRYAVLIPGIRFPHEKGVIHLDIGIPA